MGMLRSKEKNLNLELCHHIPSKKKKVNSQICFIFFDMRKQDSEKEKGRVKKGREGEGKGKEKRKGKDHRGNKIAHHCVSLIHPFL